ncbi:RING/U-box superfamily protein [Striga asiatica]|uniref:RING/U-box superfamily protein n=1 Tax=Striga asiatica TaxID=4170 RepID=A0A5A7QMY6_STRAF|nr:RING/U-box superfamily protein [Striga asiatica]
MVIRLVSYSKLLMFQKCFSGFVVTIFSTIVLCKSDDVLRKQTALKGERKITILVDIMARLAAMILKFFLLLYYKNGKAHNFRRQGQILTLVEYALLLYRALLPTPVWYRFFLNKVYGSLFSSVTTGLYLTFKLTSIVEKVRSLFAASKALSRKEVHYGSRATPEQVNAAGDLCAICQEKLQTPIVLRCKHIFCEDCVSEWFVFICSRESERALCAGLWLDLPILNRMGMDQLVFTSRYSDLSVNFSSILTSQVKGSFRSWLREKTSLFLAVYQEYHHDKNLQHVCIFM